jgi:type III secretion protein V
MSRLGKFSVGRRGLPSADIGLAALVILVVGLMIVPLPTWILDILIATNLSVAVTILLVVLYVPEALGIATFPTLLLLTTLYRLSLSVASTRLILLQANAGEVIKAFGTFVVRGNYVVGGVVFLVLTIIQFIVIAKGSERVAEVGARFQLDSMPGKQMAIDAELRGGTIDGNEARRRRHQLQRESQFYGAMDGAMKFVKGDVIASLVIVIVNILGGLAIGVSMKGMPVVDAIKRYGLLTIGDGLVTQIPALILSTAAGVLVTRVASEQTDTPLGEELTRQLLGVPKALGAAGGFVTLLALVPGLPTLPFLLIGSGLFAIAFVRGRQKRVEDARAATEPSTTTRIRGGAKEPAFVPMVVPWTVQVSADLDYLLDHGGTAPDGASIGLRGMVSNLRDRLFAELGVPLPQPRLSAREDIPNRSVVISFHEVPAKLLPIPAGLEDEGTCALVVAETLTLLRLRAGDFITLSVTQRLLDELENIVPATVRNVVPKPVSVQLLRDVLHRLVEEGVSIRDLPAILEALSSIASTDKDAFNLAEFVRGQLRRTISFRLTHGQARLDVILMDPAIEDVIRRAILRNASGVFLTLDAAAARDIRRAVDAALATLAVGVPRVFLTQPDIRRFVWQLLKDDVHDAVVVSFADLLPTIGLHPIARATIEMQATKSA